MLNSNPKIVLFTTRWNTQLDTILHTRYQVCGSKRFLFRMQKINFYAFPLFACLNRVLQKYIKIKPRI